MPNRIIASLAVVTVIITTALFTAVSASAVTTTYTQTQLSPGVQQRAIWGELQVAQYKINVTHTGYIHYEATFKPYWNYVSVFLIDKDLNVVNKVQGLYPVDVGKTVIDFKVDAISAAGAALVDPDTVADSGDEYLVGDDYTLVVQSYLGDDTKFKIWGYSPQTDLTAGHGPSPTEVLNLRYETWSYPKPSIGWLSLAGRRYGNPFDFTPTSEGALSCDLTWPATVATKTVSPALSLGQQPAAMEQTMYAGLNWDAMVVDDHDTALSNFTPPSWGSGPETWWGLHSTIALSEAGAPNLPNVVYHYVPDLFLVADDPLVGPTSGFKEGVRTVGYKATLTYPANLWISSAPGWVRAGTYATIKGTFALNGAWVPVGTAVKIQRQVGTDWSTIKTVKTTANGAWTGQVRLTKRTRIRARADGDGATGLAVEVSTAKWISVR